MLQVCRVLVREPHELSWYFKRKSFQAVSNRRLTKNRAVGNLTKDFSFCPAEPATLHDRFVCQPEHKVQAGWGVRV